MASGLPVIATDIAGIPEQIDDGETGYLIRPGDVSALADRLTELSMDSTRRERMGKRGRERVGRFSIDSMLEDIDGVYRALLDRSDDTGI
jgi:glycosyltransferase involved in cell wall biosynthesis